MFAYDVTVFCRHFPFFISLLFYIGGTAATNDLHPQLACTGSHCLSDTGRINMAIVRGVQSAEYAFEVIERMQFFYEVRINQFDVKAE